MAAATRSSVLIRMPPSKTDSQDHQRRLGQASVDLVDVTAPERLAEAVEKVRDAQRGHQQHDGILVDEMTQHQAFDQPGQHRHDADRERRRRPAAASPRTMRATDERREQHHRTLREIEHARGLEDQNEAERDQRIHDARHQSAQQHFDVEAGRRQCRTRAERPAPMASATSSSTTGQFFVRVCKPGPCPPQCATPR